MDRTQPFSTITDAYLIRRLLAGIAELRVPVYLAPVGEHNSRIVSSRLLGVENTTDRIIVQPPSPANWQQFVTPEEEVEINCYLKNGALRFTTTVTPSSADDKARCWQLKVPTELNKKQKRSYFRVPVLDLKSRITLSLGDGREVTGRCLDLSLTSTTMVLGEPHLGVTKGLEVDKCQLVIADLLNVDCAVTICRTDRTATNKQIIGLSFRQQPSGQIHEIQNAMNQLERCDNSN